MINSVLPLFVKQFPDWQKEFEAVFLESDPLKLPTLLEEAEAAMLVRQQSLTHGSEAHEERAAINNALRTLKEFKRNIMLYRIMPPAA